MSRSHLYPSTYHNGRDWIAIAGARRSGGSRTCGPGRRLSASGPPAKKFTRGCRTPPPSFVVGIGAPRRRLHQARENDDARHGFREGDRGQRGGADAHDRAARGDGQVQRGAGQGRHHAGGRRAEASSQGKRVAFDGPSRTVIDGPFAETRELVAGYWLWEVKDMAEAVEWVKRCPNPMFGPSEIEIRPVYEMADFAEAMTPEVAERSTTASARSSRAADAARRRCLDPRVIPNPMGMAADETQRAIEAVFRIERARLIAGPRADGARRRPGRGAGAGRAASPRSPNGRRPACRDNPGAWLMAAAKRRAIDGFRRDRMRARKHAEIARELDDGRATGVEAIEAALDDDIGDELLGLIFIACHPMLRREARAALTLRLIGGLTTDEIARAFLVERADDRPAHRPRQEDASRDAGLAFEVPRGAERDGAPRLGARGRLPDLQRGLCGHRRRGPGPPGALRRGAAARPHPRRPGARRARGARPARADGAPGLAPRRAHRAATARSSRSPSRTARAGTSS